VGKGLLEPPPGAPSRVILPVVSRTPYEEREDRALFRRSCQGRVVVNPEVSPEPNNGLLRPSHAQELIAVFSIDHDKAKDGDYHVTELLKPISSSMARAHVMEPPEEAARN